jgi:hypothetical protein
MSNGENTILKIRPYGLSALTIDAGLAAVFSGTTPYLTPVQTVRLHEEQRLQVQYPDGNAGAGQTWHAYTPLVPVDLVVVIKAETRAGLVDAYEDLARACMNRHGGLIQYKPDGASTSTYYHYIQSAPPKLRDESDNRWDAAAKSDGYYTMALDVSLMTRPYGTGEPDSPTAITFGGNISTQLEHEPYVIDSYEPFDTDESSAFVPASQLSGHLPPLLRLRVVDKMDYLGDTDLLGRVILFAISGESGDTDFDNFSPFYDAEDATGLDPAFWYEVSENTAFGDAFLRCAPKGDSPNEIEHVLEFGLSNMDMLTGRFAVFGIARDVSGRAGAWKHHVDLRLYSESGNDEPVILYQGDQFATDTFFSWHLLYAGEVDYPPVTLGRFSDGEIFTGLKLAWHSKRETGAVAWFDLDGVLLVPVHNEDEASTVIEILEGFGESGDTEAALVENLPTAKGEFFQRAYSIDAPPYDAGTGSWSINDSDAWDLVGGMRRPLAVRGRVFRLDPYKDHKIFGVCQIAKEAMTYLGKYSDDFSTYELEYWLSLGTLEDETEATEYTLTGGSHVKIVHGGGMGESASSSEVGYPRDLTVGNLGDNDWVFAAAIWWDGETPAASISVKFYTREGATRDQDSYTCTLVSGGSLVSGWNFVTAKKSDFTVASGSPDWAHVVRYSVIVESTTASGSEYIIEHPRIEFRNEAYNYPQPAGHWQFSTEDGAWAIVKDQATAALACLNPGANARFAMFGSGYVFKPFTLRARVKTVGWDGYAGLYLAGDEPYTNQYLNSALAFFIDTVSGELGIGAYEADGTYGTDLDNTYNVADFEHLDAISKDTWYVLGVAVVENTSSVARFFFYAAPLSLLNDDDDIFQERYLIDDIPLVPSDLTYLDIGGDLGVFFSGDSGASAGDTPTGRFDEVELRKRALMQAEGAYILIDALPRTVAPFE